MRIAMTKVKAYQDVAIKIINNEKSMVKNFKTKTFKFSEVKLMLYNNINFS